MIEKNYQINQKSNLFFKNLIFDHFYTDDSLAELIAREMILWQDCLWVNTSFLRDESTTKFIIVSKQNLIVKTCTCTAI
jgi:hypothetical protein